MHNFLCCCFCTFRISSMLLMSLNCVDRLVLYYCFLQSILYFWKLKNQINVIQKKKRFVKVHLFKKFIYTNFIESYCERVMLLLNKLIFTMNLMATANHSDNKTKLMVFSKSSGFDFRLRDSLRNSK